MHSSSSNGSHFAQRSVDFPALVIDRASKHPLLRPLFPTGMGIHQKVSDQRFSSECGQDQAILIYCSGGRGTCTIRNVGHVVNAGDLLIIPPKTPHVVESDPSTPWTISWVHVGGDNILFLIEQLGITARNPIIHLGDDPQIFALYEDALSAAERDHTYTTTHLFHASQTVGHLLALINLRLKTGLTRAPTVKERVAYCVEFMKQHLAEPLRLDRLAALTNLSPSHFGIQFREEMGATPMAYLIHLRMERAADLLKTTDLAMKEIGNQIGFHEHSHFCRAFRQMYSITPSEYRESFSKCGRPR